MDKLQVTQSDRDAAVSFARWFGWGSDECLAIEEGLVDETHIVQAFARHRISAERRIVEWLRLMSDCLNSRTTPCGYCAGCGRRYAADAIARGDHREKEA